VIVFALNQCNGKRVVIFDRLQLCQGAGMWYSKLIYMNYVLFKNSDLMYCITLCSFFSTSSSPLILCLVSFHDKMLNTKNVLMLVVMSAGILTVLTGIGVSQVHQPLPTRKSVNTMMTTTVTRGPTR
jgi:hypothetical protein